MPMFQLLCVCGYLVPAYYLTGQPLEWVRFGGFFLFNTAISLTAQGYGFMIGATLPVGVSLEPNLSFQSVYQSSF